MFGAESCRVAVFKSFEKLPLFVDKKKKEINTSNIYVKLLLKMCSYLTVLFPVWFLCSLYGSMQEKNSIIDVPVNTRYNATK